MATDRDIWNDSEWLTRRNLYRSYQKWYEGVPLDEEEDATDRATGDKVRPVTSPEVRQRTTSP
jgi:hypothetical protein